MKGRAGLHQTVRLSKGRHRDAAHGTCIAELTSMLGGERFSDHPKCACPALTAFLRGYNDGLNDRKRQDLYAIASDLVGTRADEATSTMRGNRLVELAWQYQRRVGLFPVSPTVNFAIRFDRYQGAGLHLGKCARRQPDCHAAVLALLKELCDGVRPDDRSAPRREELPQERGALVG